MTKIRVIKESETEKSKQSFSIVIRSADESLGPSTIQLIRDSRVVESPSLAPGVSSLFHTHRAEQSAVTLASRTAQQRCTPGYAPVSAGQRTACTPGEVTPGGALRPAGIA